MRESKRKSPSIVTIGTMKTVKTFFFAFPALNSTAMNKKLKYSILYPIKHEMKEETLKVNSTRMRDNRVQMVG